MEMGVSVSEEEEDMIDSVFYRCDSCSAGHVQVQKVIEFLKNCLGNGNNDSDLLELAAILKHDSTDDSISLTAYRSGVKQWIANIRNRCESTSSQESERLQPPSHGPADTHNVSNNSADVSICIETSMCHEGSFHRRELDIGELMGQIDDLKFQNHKLSEENGKLHSQMEVQEETATSLAAELQGKCHDTEQLKKKMKSLQDSVNFRQAVLEENEELKSKLSHLQELKRDLDSKIVSLERENMNLDNQARNFENKWQKCLTEMEGIKKEFVDLQASHVEQKHILFQCQESKNSQEEAYSNKLKELNEVKERLNELVEQNEKLQDEKDDVQVRLTQTNGKLQRYRVKTAQLGLVDESLVEDDSGGDVSQISPKLQYSTPLTKHSICMELKDRLNEDKHLPSPLCEKLELSNDVPSYLRSVVLPTYMSAWELDITNGSLQDFSLEHLKNRKSLSPQLSAVDIEKKFLSLKDLEKDALQKEIIRLYGVNVDLAEKCHKAELKETELKELMTSQKSTLELPQESLVTSYAVRDLDLKDLWRLVHGADEDESSESDTSLSTPLSTSTELLKQQIQQDIEALRQKLQKRDSGVGSLRNHTSKLLDFRCKGRQSSSRLVDALNIEFPYSRSDKYQNSCSDSSFCKSYVKHQRDKKHCIHTNRSVPLTRRNDSAQDTTLSSDSCSTTGAVDITHNNDNMQHRHKIPDRFTFEGSNSEGLTSLESNTSDHRNSCLASPSNVVVDSKIGRDKDRGTQSEETSPLLRRGSYLTAIENETCSVEEVHIARSRSYSFQSAIEQGQKSPSEFAETTSPSSVGNTTPDNGNESTDSLWWSRTAPKYSSTPLPTITKASKPNTGSGGITKSVNFHPETFVKQNKEKAGEVVGMDGTDAMLKDTNEECKQDNAMSLKADLLKGGGIHSSRSSCCTSHQLSILLEEDASGEPEPLCPATCYDECHMSQNATSYQSSSRGSSERSSLSQVDDFSPEVWTLSHSGSGDGRGDMCSSRDSGHSSSITNEEREDLLENKEDLTDDFRESKSSVGRESTGSPVVPPSTKQEFPGKLSAFTPAHNSTACSFSPQNLSIESLSMRMEDLVIHSETDSNADITTGIVCDKAKTHLAEKNMANLDTQKVTANNCTGNDKSATESNKIATNTIGNDKIAVTVPSKGICFKSSSNSFDSARNMSPSERILMKSAGKNARNMANNGRIFQKPSEVQSLMSVNSQISSSAMQTNGSLSPKQNSEIISSVTEERERTQSSLKPLTKSVQSQKSSSPASICVPVKEEKQTGVDSQVTHKGNEMRMKGPNTEKADEMKEVEPNNNRKANQVIIAEDDHGDSFRIEEQTMAPNAFSSNLSKIRQSHLAKRRGNLQQNKMPQLSELAEKDHSDENGEQDMDSLGEKDDIMKPPIPNGDVVMPSIPLAFLRKLGLADDNDVNSDELSEQEIESKFSSLSLAFKTDGQTLEKRLEIQERSRDIAEQNVDKELQGLRNGLATLNQICTDPQVREVLTKIQNHIDILEKSTARVSSRAEVYGAIQQEKRMSRAVDIMVHHVENIRRVHEKEHAELEEARKLLQDSRSLAPSPLDLAGGEMLSRRSASVCQNNMFTGKLSPIGASSPGFVTPSAVKAIKLMKASRRRVSEIALPKVLGGSGAPNLHPSSSMDYCYTEPRSFPRYSPLRNGISIDEDEGNLESALYNGRSVDKDARSRFQAVVASTTVKSAVANTLRRASLEKQNNVQMISPVNTQPQVTRDNSADSNKLSDIQEKEKQKNLEEEAFKKGYEQGMRASLGQDLSGLREQQNHINESLGDIMDSIDNHMEEPRSLKEIMLGHVHDNIPKITISGWRIRLTMGCFFIVMAVISVIISLFPVGSATLVGYRHFGKPPV